MAELAADGRLQRGERESLSALEVGNSDEHCSTNAEE